MIGSFDQRNVIFMGWDGRDGLMPEESNYKTRKQTKCIRDKILNRFYYYFANIKSLLQVYFGKTKQEHHLSRNEQWGFN